MRDAGDLVDAVLREIRLHAGVSRARQRPEPDDAPYQVVVVDDDECTRLLYAEALRGLGLLGFGHGDVVCCAASQSRAERSK